MGATGYQKLGGHVVMRRAAAHAAALLFFQKTGWAIAHSAHPPVTPVFIVLNNERVNGFGTESWALLF